MLHYGKMVCAGQGLVQKVMHVAMTDPQWELLTTRRSGRQAAQGRGREQSSDRSRRRQHAPSQSGRTPAVTGEVTSL